MAGIPMGYLFFFHADFSGLVFDVYKLSRSELSAAVLNNYRFVG